MPRTGELYRHKDGGFYRVLTIARDVETLNERVVYEHVWPFDPSFWVRDLEAWASRFFLVPELELESLMDTVDRDAARAEITTRRTRRKADATR